MQNYTVFHLHSDLSTGVTNIDSVTKYGQYIERAKECGMKALGFSCHGSLFEWYHKKCDIEAAGMKYIHGVECYLTENIEEKIRDNYHLVLMARNKDGFKELNRLVSKSFNRKDGHFYYVPRITLDELWGTSDNIIVTTACLGGPLHNGTLAVKRNVLDFVKTNKNRCFLEIQHHPDAEQAAYNKYLVKLNKKYGIPLIAGTDTHALNKEHLEARAMLQKGKGVRFPGEDTWELDFKTYDELLESYERQGVIPQEIYLEAIENTNVLADMIEEYSIDNSIKYPKIYENPLETLKEKINAAYKIHPYIKDRYPIEQVREQIHEEVDTFEKTKSIDFMLMQTYLREWEHKNEIFCGPGRGSVSGSLAAYILGITDMDSIKFDLNFFRFSNPDRVSLGDIDSDYGDEDRKKVKEFLLKEHMGLPTIKSSEIITFNTIKMKGAIKDIGRALGMSVQETQEISNAVCDEQINDKYREKYPELFKYVDLCTGVIVSLGIHPGGVLISDYDIEEELGLCSLSTTDYPVSMLNMKELDALNYVKLDILGLANVDIINKTCKIAGIERMTPDNVDLNDEAVWKSIRDDTTGIFQWESNSAQALLKKFMSDEVLDAVRERVPNFSWIKWFSFGNGLLRPGCASFRDKAASGIFYDNGLEELNTFLAPTMGYLTMQEDIMKFLVQFCGYTQAESDNCRRAIAKKKGTESLLPEIEERFINYTSEHYNVSKEKCAEVIKPFLQVILDASSYSFSWNHSDAYSCIGYICGYLRYYYPLEFLTASLNVFWDDAEKTLEIIKYTTSQGVAISPIKFRYSRSDYSFDKATNAIYKGMASIKYLNKKIAEELYALRENTYDNFFDLMRDIKTKTSVDERQLSILVKLNFFEEFGDIKNLLQQIQIINEYAGRSQLKKEEVAKLGLTHEEMISIGGNETELLYRNIDGQKLATLLIKRLPETKTSIKERIDFEIEHLGYTSLTIPNIDPSYAYVSDINAKYKNPVLTLYRLKDGAIETVKVRKRAFDEDIIQKGDIIKTISSAEEQKWGRNPDGSFYRKENEFETILKKWSIVND